MLKTDDEVVIAGNEPGSAVPWRANNGEEVYLDRLMTVAAPNPLTADQFGNVRVWVRRTR